MEYSLNKGYYINPYSWFTDMVKLTTPYCLSGTKFVEQNLTRDITYYFD
jgi:hypothetical protein